MSPEPDPDPGVVVTGPGLIPVITGEAPPTDPPPDPPPAGLLA